MSVGKEREIPQTNKKVLSGELFLGAVALQTPIHKYHYMHDNVPFPKYCYIYMNQIVFVPFVYMLHKMITPTIINHSFFFIY